MTAIDPIQEVINTLTGPEGCPWDKKQTPQSLCDYLAEECFELIEAIRLEQTADIREELGDVLFLLLFIAKLQEETHPGFLEQSIQENVTKMVRRHPHVYGEATASIPEVMRNWERIKKEEKAEKNAQSGVFASLPASLPPLLRAYRINAKAARVGFTWATDNEQQKILQSEWQELQEALTTGSQAEQEEEFGDYLFSLVEYARRKGIKANAALAGANAKFLQRFERMEALARERQLVFEDLSLTEMDELWDTVKTQSSR